MRQFKFCVSFPPLNWTKGTGSTLKPHFLGDKSVKNAFFFSKERFESLNLTKLTELT